MKLTPIQEIALTKFKPGEDSRDKIKPGPKEGEFLARISYSLNVAVDTDKAASASIPWQDIAVAALAFLTADQEREVIDDAFEGQVDETAKAMLKAALEPKAKAIADTLDRIPVSGSVTGRVAIERIEEPAEAPVKAKAVKL